MTLSFNDDTVIRTLSFNILSEQFNIEFQFEAISIQLIQYIGSIEVVAASYTS